MKSGMIGDISEFCFFQTRKYYSDGSIGIIMCSVDHKDVPLVNCAKLDLIANYLEPCSENSSKFYCLNQMKLENFSLINTLVLKSDFLLTRLTKRAKNVSEVLERDEKLKMKEMKKEMKEMKKEIESRN